MLQIEIPDGELFDEQKEVFVKIKGSTLQLEHSLVSLAKWESKWKIPFLSDKEKTREQTIDYIRCMTLTQNVNPLIYLCITNDNIHAVNEYINDSMTATWFSKKDKKKPSNQVITAEIIYYWMVALQIPFECQKWHLNRLLTLVHVCDEKNAPATKMSKKDIMKRNSSLNAARRARLHSKG